MKSDIQQSIQRIGNILPVHSLLPACGFIKLCDFY